MKLKWNWNGYEIEMDMKLKWIWNWYEIEMDMKLKLIWNWYMKLIRTEFEIGFEIGFEFFKIIFKGTVSVFSSDLH